MKSFHEMLLMIEQNPLGGAGAPGGLPPGPPAGPPPGPPMGGPPMGGPPGGGLGGPPMGPPGAPGAPAGGPQQAQTTNLEPLDVWAVLEKIADGKKVEDDSKDQARQEPKNSVNSGQPSQPSAPIPPSSPAPTGMPAPPGQAAQPAAPQHLLGPGAGF